MQGCIVEPKAIGAESLQSSCVIHLVFNLLSFPLWVGERSLRRGQLRSQRRNPRLYLSLRISLLFCFIFQWLLLTVDLTVLIFPVFSNPIAFNQTVSPNAAKKVFCVFFVVVLAFVERLVVWGFCLFLIF